MPASCRLPEGRLQPQCPPILPRERRGSEGGAACPAMPCGEAATEAESFLLLLVLLQPLQVAAFLGSFRRGRYPAWAQPRRQQQQDHQHPRRAARFLGAVM